MRVEAGERRDQEQQASGAGNEPQDQEARHGHQGQPSGCNYTPVASGRQTIQAMMMATNGICSPSNRRMTD